MFPKKLILVMTLALVLVACGQLADSISGQVTLETEETQSVIVNGVPSLLLNHFAGSVHIRDGEAGTITATLTRKSRLNDETEARAQLELITMAFTQSGTDVTLSIEEPDDFAEMVTGPSADLEMLVPPGTTLNINQGAGELTVERPSGDVTVNLGAGNATVTLPETASFRLVVTGGVVTIKSDFAGVPSGGVASDVDAIVGGDPTQTLSFNLGAGDVNLRKE